jgi:hypothetical protein
MQQEDTMVALLISLSAALELVALGVGVLVLGQPAAPLAAKQRRVHHEEHQYG